MNTTNNRQYDYVIGIDFGHGETSAAICAMDWDTPTEQLDAAKDLEMGGNRKVLPSAIAILKNGVAKIGDAAFHPDTLMESKVHVCFKQAPKDINGEAEQLMIRFMKEVYNQIRINNSGLLTDSNHLVYIATPSGWDLPTQQLYVEMAKKAGLPIPQNGVTKESRAAFVKAQADTTCGLGRNIDKGAIVFDMGSSTLDFTYMNGTLPNIIDNGYDCGASRVEKTIFAKYEGENQTIKAFENKYPELRDYLLFEARKVKEQVYFDPTLKVKKTVNFEDIIDDEEFEEERFRMSFSPGDLDSLLMEVGYMNEIEQAMIDFKEKYIPGQPIYGVFLTGGASRMDFIRNLVSKCWGVSQDLIRRDPDPSLTISQGVAEVARVDMRTGEMDSTLEEDINKLLNGSAIYDIFINTFGQNMYEKLVDNLADTINDFASSSYDSSVNDLNRNINSTVQRTISSESALISDYIQSSIQEGVEDINNKVEDIIKSYSQNGMNIQMETVQVTAPSINDINMNSVIQNISQRIAAESGGWSSVITGAAIGFAAAFLLGPIGWAAAGLYAFINANKSEAEKRREAMSKSLDQNTRQQVVNAISEKWEDIKQSIANSILASLQNDQNIKNAINNSTHQLLLSYKENLKKARLLIE